MFKIAHRRRSADFSGVRIGQDLTGLFESPGGAASATNTNHSRFTGAGPRLGMEGQYALGDFRLIGELAMAALVGIEQPLEPHS
jgi:hypothetical protein